MPEPSRSYRSASVVALGFFVYCLALPLVFRFFLRYLPAALRTCGMQRLFSRPCPMCGLTRGVSAVMWGRFAQACDYNVLSIPVFVLLLGEVLYRLWVVLANPGPDRARRLAGRDIRIHAVLLAAYVVYAAWFMLKKTAAS